MPNMRIVWDNAASRATITASTQAGAFTASKLKSPSRSSVWRATGNTATLTLAWPSDENIACVSLPMCNLSPTATVRVRLLNSASAVLYDSGLVTAASADAAKLIGWTAAQAASAYSFGGGNCATLWFAKRAVRSLTIDIADTNNLQGYVEAVTVVAGDYWSPKLNPAWNPSLSLNDSTKHSRTDAGSLRSDMGFRFRKLNLNLANMVDSDRGDITAILRAVGLFNPMFVSLFPEDTDKRLERDYSMLCKLSQISAITLPNWNSYSAPLELEEA